MRSQSRSAQRAVALLCLAAVLGALGCAPYSTSVIPPLGILYSKVSAPLIVPDPTLDISGLESVEVHTGQLQPIMGTPPEVPDPRMVTRIGGNHSTPGQILLSWRS